MTDFVYKPQPAINQNEAIQLMQGLFLGLSADKNAADYSDF